MQVFLAHLSWDGLPGQEGAFFRNFSFRLQDFDVGSALSLVMSHSGIA